MNKRVPPPIIAELVEYLTTTRDKFTKAIVEDPVCAPTGSRVICNPAPTDTDDDWLVYVPETMQEAAMAWLTQRGATHADKQEVYPDGVCFRYGEINPVLIWDYDTFYRWVAATHYAAKLNIADKAERTRMFAAIVDRKVMLADLIL